MKIFQPVREPSGNRKDLRALTLVGPIWENPVPDPLAVQHWNVDDSMMNHESPIFGFAGFQSSN